MAHIEQREFIEVIKSNFPRYFKKARVLEIGSLNINGSVRSQFSDCDYVGVDVAPGAGVDVVQMGQLVDFPSESFDCVISCECMEHNTFWVETMSNMFRLVRPSGLVIMTCASPGREEHGTARSVPKSSPLTVDLGWDYYSNVSEKDLRSRFNLDWWFSDYVLSTHYRMCDTYFVALKKPREAPVKFKKLKKEVKELCNPFNSSISAMIYLSFKLGGKYLLSIFRWGATFFGRNRQFQVLPK